MARRLAELALVERSKTMRLRWHFTSVVAMICWRYSPADLGERMGHPELTAETMTTSTTPEKLSSTERYPDLLAGLLSLAVPGLGQVWQGWRWRYPSRLLKGLVLLVVLHGMFFYGQALGQWKNVFLPQYQQAMGEEFRVLNVRMPDWLANVYWRPAYALQFWMGITAWPAIWNYCFPESKLFANRLGEVVYQPSPGAAGPQVNRWEREQKIKEFHRDINQIQLRPDMGKRWDLGLLYTMLAGVLNLLVIYEAYAGPFERSERRESRVPLVPGAQQATT
ncbi:hypothetical protein HRbin36_00536 [bacterium HR36]|nr:hypothetical protein HRbin36_00536 [bacterium HR36]